MTFSHPQAFFLLVLVILFVILVIYNFRKKKKVLNEFISDSAYKKLGFRSGKEIDFFKSLLIILALIFFMVALAGPEWGKRFESVDIKGIEITFLLDTSNSMSAEDLRPNRLEVAKQLITTVVDKFKTDYVSLINFAGIAYVQCPLTIDYEALKLMAEASVISPSEEQGTDFHQAFNLALKSFKSTKDAHKIIILITDGEDQEGGWLEVVSGLKEQKIIVFTVGIGAVSGAPIPIKDDKGEISGWKKDNKGNIVKTRLAEDTLIQIAAKTGGQYFRLTDDAAIDVFVSNLQSFERTVLTQRIKMKKIKRFHYPLIVGIILLILELILTEKKLKWRKE